LYGQSTVSGGIELWTLPIDATDPDHPKPGQPQRYLQDSGIDGRASFSPDGRWVAYVSSESGRQEVYVRPFPGPGGRWPISNNGGTDPKWSKSGTQLFYNGPPNSIQVVDYTAKGESFMAQKPRPWSTAQIPGVGIFDPMPDGKRLVAALATEERAEAPRPVTHATFLLNFFDELRRRVPTGK
jgi:hypothetical protein